MNNTAKEVVKALQAAEWTLDEIRKVTIIIKETFNGFLTGANIDPDTVELHNRQINLTKKLNKKEVNGWNI